MVFSSLIFLFRFLPLVLLAYYVAPKRFRNAILFLFSLVFYAWGEPVYVVLILLSTIVDYTAGRVVAAAKEKQQLHKAKRAVLTSVMINLLLLGFFKYCNFIIHIICSVTGLVIADLNLALPIGISFYTFQTMSYTIDVYRSDAKVQKNFITFGAYVSLFPQLIAGPIIRYKSIAEQLDERKESIALFYQGVIRFVTGLAKKVLIANQVGAVFHEISSMPSQQLSTATAWLGILCFTFQIYFDFSGYSDMAIGLGKMFGFTFPENFNYPYESKSITEFWRRWHISLGTWFKEYVYIPLGGNRLGITRQMINIAIVWFLTGLWHGANWNFVLWGVYYGVILVIEKIWLKKVFVRLPAFVGHMYTMLIVVIGWSLFSWQDMMDSAGYMKAMFFQAQCGITDGKAAYMLLSHIGILLIAVFGSLSVTKRVVLEKMLPDCTIRREVAGVLFILVMMLACVAVLVNSSYNPFLYFRF